MNYRSVGFLGLCALALGIYGFRRVQNAKRVTPDASATRVLRNGGGNDMVLVSDPQVGRAKAGTMLEVPERDTMLKPHPFARPVATILGNAHGPFLAWLEEFRARSNDAAVIVRGQELARARKEWMKQTMRADPAAALALQLSTVQRLGLPAALAAELETPLDARGNLSVLAICGQTGGALRPLLQVDGRTYNAHAVGHRQSSRPAENVAVHGFVLDDDAVVSDRPFRQLDAGERATLTSGDPQLMALVGSELKEFSDHVTMQSELAALYAEDEKQFEAPRAAAISTGTRRLVFVRAQFSDATRTLPTDAAARAMLEQARIVIAGQSAGKLTYAPTIVAGSIQLPKPLNYYETNADYGLELFAVHATIRADLAKAGMVLGDEDLLTVWHPHLRVFIPGTLKEIAGYAAFGGNRINLNGDLATRTMVHEIGHTLGLSHATRVAVFEKGRPLQAAAPKDFVSWNVEYGDIGSVMGANRETDPLKMVFNVPEKVYLKWISSDRIREVDGEAEFTLARQDGSAPLGWLGARVNIMDRSDVAFWIEHARSTEGVVPQLTRAVTIRATLLDARTGVVAMPAGFGAAVLDANPEPWGVNHPVDYEGWPSSQTPLTVGGTFSDLDHLLNIQLKNVTSGENSTAQVAVTLGAPPGSKNHNPVLGFIAPDVSLRARQSYTFPISAIDPDGDPLTRVWDDGVVRRAITGGTYEGWWNIGGTYRTKVDVRDGKDGIALGAATITVNDPLTSWTRQNPPTGTGGIAAVRFLRGRFFAAAYSSTNGMKIMSSPDGRTWTPAQSPSYATINYSGIRDFAADANRLVAVGSKGINGNDYSLVLESSDGVTWTEPASIPDGGRLLTVASAGGIFVAAGIPPGGSASTGRILRSTAAGTWEQFSTGLQTDGSPSANSTAVAYFKNQFVVVGPRFGLAVSSDGRTWTRRTLPTPVGLSPGATVNLNTLIALESELYAASTTGLAAWRTSDGTTWSSIASARPYVAMVPFENGFLSFGEGGGFGSSRISFSRDLISWGAVAVDSAISPYLVRVAVGDDGLVAVGNSGEIYRCTLPAAVAAPVITRQPAASVRLAAGGRLDLTAEVQNAAGVTYVWVKNGSPLPSQTAVSLSRSAVTVADTGVYQLFVYSQGGGVTSTSATVEIDALPQFTSHPQSATAKLGDRVALTAQANGSPAVTLQWYRNGQALAGAAQTSYVIASLQESDAGQYYVVAKNTLGEVQSQSATMAILRAPTVTAQPQSQTAVAGATVTFTVAASGSQLSYQWKKGDSSILTGETGSTLTLRNVSTLTEGFFSITVTNAAGSITSSPAQLTIRSPNPGRLVNLSILTSLGSPNDTFTVGVVVGGSGTSASKPLLVRAVGPSLAAFGLPDLHGDPKLELYAGSTKVGENDNWGGNQTVSGVMAQVGAFEFASASSKDAAIYAPAVAAGGNSVVISGVGGTTGAVIAELYDATPSSAYQVTTPRLVNVSVLKHIGSGLTAGFVIGGTTPMRVLVRAVGPGLAVFDVSGAVADPQLALFAGPTKMFENDNWGGTPALTAAFSGVGAFVLPATSRDAAAVVTLAPGNYTVQVSGVGGTTGIALVEIYEVP